MAAQEVTPAVAVTVSLDEPAELVAVTAEEDFPHGSSVQVRVLDEAGWSAWTTLHVEAEHGPDPGSAEARGARFGSDPLMAVDASQVQVRIDTPSGALPGGTQLTAVDAPSSASDGATSQVAAMAAVGQPPIVTRAQWGADESLRSRAPYYTDTVRAGFVHHTASTSSYTRAQAAAQIRAIYAYHTKSLGHSDIDYNFVVDRFGRLYEGRAGGITKPVLGAHTAGFNENTFAVVALGNFQTFNPSAADMAAMKDSIARLFAWKLGLHGVSPDATVKLVSAGYIKATRYPKGSVATISATSSHQTVNFTACPGTNLQEQLPAIRALGGRYSDVVISAPSPPGTSVVAGSTDGLTFTMSADRAVTWTADVISPCSDTPVRSFSGRTTTKGPIALRWDLRDGSGRPVLPAEYTIRVSGRADDGTPVPTVTSQVTITPAPGGAWGPCANASRVVGSSLARTSVLWGRISAPDSRLVVLSGSGTGAASTSAALAAAPLARSLRAPLLLTPAGDLSDEVAGDIRARRATEILVVGATAVVSDAVATSAAALGAKVTRLSGSTAAATAAAVAGRMKPGLPAVLVSPSGSPAHSISGAALASALGVPLLLADGSSIPAATRTALAGRPSVTVVASPALSDTAIRAGLGSVAWSRVTGSDAVAASLAASARVPGSPESAMILPENPDAWGAAPVAASTGAPLLITTSPSLAPQVADFLSARPSLRATTAPVSSAWLDDLVLGATSRVLLGLPWAPPGVDLGSSASPTSKRKVYRANAKPEPVRAGATVTVTAKVKAKYTDNKYRSVPPGVSFKVQFKPRGAKSYRSVGSGVTTTGRATATVKATKSGRYRIVVGSKKSRSDYVRVTR
jgi:hypothetical protein